MSDEESTSTEEETFTKEEIMVLSATKCGYLIALTNEIQHEFGADFWMKEGSVELLDGLLKFYGRAQKALNCTSFFEFAQIDCINETLRHQERKQPLITDMLKKKLKSSTSA